ncbi:MAG: MFS transporter [Candidatus Omnitrophica bacterium]|nr:MFS transporter [Candidatus Omnitrophota bacterium]
MKLKGIPQIVWIFGLVSFLTDVSSDMVFPLLPVFLTQYLGAQKGFLGLVEGFADSTAAFFMLFSGILADRARDRSKIVLAGYSLSSLAKPILAFAWTPWVVFFIRFTDRMGKGIRSSPRDALIADSVEPFHRGKAYGLQRSMDNAGAMIGPLIATILLATLITDLRKLFLIASVPGLLAVALIFWKVREVVPVAKRTLPQKFQMKFPAGKLRLYLIILAIFILSCSSDAFLLLRAQELGIPAKFLPLLWMILQGVKAAAVLPFGMLSDKIGRRKMMLIGWTVYTLVYLGFGHASQTWHAWVLFAFYGLFYGLTEGTERAILADYSEPSARGQAFGWYYFVVGTMALPASLLFGLLWQKWGSQTAFTFSASISGICVFLLYVFLKLVPSSNIKMSQE